MIHFGMTRARQGVYTRGRVNRHSGKTNVPGTVVCLRSRCPRSNSPIQQRMNEFGVTDLESIAKRAGETYVICERFNAEMLRVYLQAHYGTTVVCDLRYVNPLLGAAAVWQLKIIDPPPHSS